MVIKRIIRLELTRTITTAQKRLGLVRAWLA